MVTCLAVFEATSSASSVSRKSAYEASLAVASCRTASRRSRLLNSRSRCICSCKRSSWAALMASPPRRRAPRRWRDPGSRPRARPGGRARSGARTRAGGRSGRWRPGRVRAGCGADVAGQRFVLGDEAPAMSDVQPTPAPGDLDGLADEGEGDRVAIRLEAHEVILGDAPRLARFQAEAGLTSSGDQMAPLVDKAVGGALVGGAVNPHVGDLGLPLAELLAQILLVEGRSAGEEIPLEVLHARFDLALGLRPVGPTEVGLEAPIVGELLEGRIPDDPPLAGGVADRPRPIVQMLARVPAEILEGPFMGVEELAERLRQARLVKAAPRVAERQDEHVQEDRLGREVDPCLAPVDLALLPRRGLRAARRPLDRLLHRAQRPPAASHRPVAAAVP